MGAYRYGRPHVGYQALMANALLTFQGALGYVTELLSGDFNAPFGRSSHHQVWSEAMVVTPLVRGLLGLEVGRRRPPPDLRAAAARGLGPRVGAQRWPSGPRGGPHARARGGPDDDHGDAAAAAPRPCAWSSRPAFPLDARVRSVAVDGQDTPFRMRRDGDVQRAEVELRRGGRARARRVRLRRGHGRVHAASSCPSRAPQQGLRILRARAEDGALRLALEGLAGRTYRVGVRTPRRRRGPGRDGDDERRAARTCAVAFEGAAGAYVRRTDRPSPALGGSRSRDRCRTALVPDPDESACGRPRASR